MPSVMKHETAGDRRQEYGEWLRLKTAADSEHSDVADATYRDRFLRGKCRLLEREYRARRLSFLSDKNGQNSKLVSFEHKLEGET